MDIIYKQYLNSGLRYYWTIETHMYAVSEHCWVSLHIGVPQSVDTGNSNYTYIDIVSELWVYCPQEIHW